MTTEDRMLIGARCERGFEMRPDGDMSLFIATIPIRTGPEGAWLNRREFNAVRQHMKQEG